MTRTNAKRYKLWQAQSVPDCWPHADSFCLTNGMQKKRFIHLLLCSHWLQAVLIMMPTALLLTV